jgi:rhodanese-related sulfurtransferase
VLGPALALACLTCGCGPTKTSDRDLTFVGPAEADQLVGGRRGLLGLGGTVRAVWVDPRPEEKYAEAHIPHAIHMPFDQVADEHGRLSTYDLIIVYGTGYRDPLAEGMSKRLVELGHKDVRTLRGGLVAWRAEGFPVEGDESD